MGAAYRALYCNVSFNKKMNTILIIGLMAVAAVASVDEFDQNAVVPEEVEVARTIGPVSHRIGNSQFAKKGDHRVDDVDDTESPWACSLYNSPWFACVPRHGDKTKVRNYPPRDKLGKATQRWLAKKGFMKEKKVYFRPRISKRFRSRRFQKRRRL